MREQERTVLPRVLELRVSLYMFAVMIQCHAFPIKTEEREQASGAVPARLRREGGRCEVDSSAQSSRVKLLV